MNEHYKSSSAKPFRAVASQIEIKDCQNIREIYDSAMNYVYNGKPPEMLRERDVLAYMVNNIRHEYSNYNKLIREVDRCRDYPKTYYTYKNMVLDRIENKYPFLKSACESQKTYINIVKRVYPNKY